MSQFDVEEAECVPHLMGTPPFGEVGSRENHRTETLQPMACLDSGKKKCYAPPLLGERFSVLQPARRAQFPAMGALTAVSTEGASKKGEETPWLNSAQNVVAL